jgi:hypothetical protein
MAKNLRSGTVPQLLPHTGVQTHDQLTVAVAPTRRVESQVAVLPLGWFPALSLIGAFGLFLVATAHSGARADAPWSGYMFLAGLATLLLPITFRLLSLQASRQERFGLVAFLCLALYLSKILYSPYAFTFPDELVHTHNVREIIQHQHLFGDNPILKATPFYPGLATLTSAAMMFSGLPVFGAGVVVIGVARLILILTLFRFHEYLSGSARVGGIAVLLYMGNSTYVFWDAQFAYASLAVPLAVLTLFMVARREEPGSTSTRASLSFVTVMIALSVVMTHHMSSYALTVYLWALTVVILVAGKLLKVPKERTPSTIGLALFVAIAVVTWLLYVATVTIGYLSPVLGGAIKSIIQLILREETGRQLFQSSSGYVAPLWERGVGIGSVLLIILGLPFGLYRFWRTRRHNLFALMLALVALLYFPVLGMRFSGAAWETANRASEFLFVGISFVVALGIAEFWLVRRDSVLPRLLFTGAIAVIFAGGVISGWQPNVRLARTYEVAAGKIAIVPPGVEAARWARTFLGPDNRMVADETNAGLMAGYGEQIPLTGTEHGVHAMFFSDQVGRTEREILNVVQVRYAVVDRRMISWDHMVGLYFNRPSKDARQGTELFGEDIYQKFDRSRETDRIFDSGDIVIYNVSRLSGVQ